MITVTFEGLCALADRKDAPWTVVAPIGSHPHRPLLIAKGVQLDIAPDRFTWWPDYAFLAPSGEQLCVWSLARTTLTIGHGGSAPAWQGEAHGGLIDFSRFYPDARLVPAKAATGAVVTLNGGTADALPHHKVKATIKKDGGESLFEGLVPECIRWTGAGANDGRGEYIESPLGRVAFRAGLSPTLVISNTSPTADSGDHFDCYYDVVSPAPPKPRARLFLTPDPHHENAESGINCIPNLRFDI